MTHLSTADLLAGLRSLDEAPWSDWYGSPLSARGLARLLEPYGIGPVQRRVRDEDKDKVRAYWRQDFIDAWHRYVPAPTSGTSGTSGTDGIDWDAAERATDDDAESWAGAQA